MLLLLLLDYSFFFCFMRAKLKSSCCDCVVRWVKIKFKLEYNRDREKLMSCNLKWSCVCGSQTSNRAINTSRAALRTCRFFKCDRCMWTIRKISNKSIGWDSHNPLDPWNKIQSLCIICSGSCWVLPLGVHPYEFDTELILSVGGYVAFFVKNYKYEIFFLFGRWIIDIQH